MPPNEKPILPHKSNLLWRARAPNEKGRPSGRPCFPHNPINRFSDVLRPDSAGSICATSVVRAGREASDPGVLTVPLFSILPLVPGLCPHGHTQPSVSRWDDRRVSASDRRALRLVGFEANRLQPIRRLPPASAGGKLDNRHQNKPASAGLRDQGVSTESGCVKTGREARLKPARVRFSSVPPVGAAPPPCRYAVAGLRSGRPDREGDSH